MAACAVSARWEGGSDQKGTPSLLQVPGGPGEDINITAVEGEGAGAVMPFRRKSSRKSELVDVLRGRYGDEEEASDSSTTTASTRASATPEKRNSQCQFAERQQTVIVYDWDDTLFPTSFLFDSLHLDLAVPLAQQRRLGSRAKEVIKKLAKCENHAVKILQESHMAGQVVLVTLAVKGWVEQACRLFYPKVGELLRQLNIKVVSARQEKATTGNVNVSKGLVKAKCRSEEEYWGLLKGRAISNEIEQFYSQYEGQSWKNVISIGDSQFERYGLLAASTAYIQNKRMSQLDVAPLLPAQAGAWQKMDVNQDREHEIRLRVKCCKLLVDPDMDELVVELNTIGKWLTSMVKLDEGFDIDFEVLTDVEQVTIVEGVLRGERPVTELPKV